MYKSRHKNKDLLQQSHTRSISSSWSDGGGNNVIFSALAFSDAYLTVSRACWKNASSRFKSSKTSSTRTGSLVVTTGKSNNATSFNRRSLAIRSSAVYRKKKISGGSFVFGQQCNKLALLLRVICCSTIKSPSSSSISLSLRSSSGIPRELSKSSAS